MRVYFTAAAAAMFMMTSAFAQNAAKPAANDATMPAVATPESANPNAPVAGSNSFTETQARERLSKAGYADVSGLAKDDKGVWRGKAMKSGARIDVALDYQGNITGQ